MKRQWLLLIAIVAAAVGRAFADDPCTNVFVYNATIAGHMTPADLLAKNGIEEHLKSAHLICFKGYDDSGDDWQVQTHQKTDVLLAYSLGTLDDGNGVGAVGKTIEVITYDVYAWDKKLSRTVNSGPLRGFRPIEIRSYCRLGRTGRLRQSCSSSL